MSLQIAENVIESSSLLPLFLNVGISKEKRLRNLSVAISLIWSCTARLKHERASLSVFGLPSKYSRARSIMGWAWVMSFPENMACHSPANESCLSDPASEETDRSEERRVGEEGRSRGAPYH